MPAHTWPGHNKVQWPLAYALTVVGALLAWLLGVGVAHQPLLLAVPVVPFALIGILFNSAFRVAFVTYGGLLVLQSSDQLDAQKIVYLLGCVLVFSVSVTRTMQYSGKFLNWAVADLVKLSVSWVILVLVSFLVSAQNGANIMNWVRDIIPYLLVAAVPFLAIDSAIDAERGGESKILKPLFLLYGGLSSVAFFVEWLVIRGFTSIPFENPIFPTFMFSCVLFSYAVSRALSSGLVSGWWAAVAAVIFIMFVLTGTRTSLVMLAAPIAVLGSQGSLVIKKAPKYLLLAIIAVGTAVATFSFLPSLVGIDISSVLRRFTTLAEITSEDSFAGQSLESRASATSVLIEAFRDAPVFGQGPGQFYTYLNYAGEDVTKMLLDSPMSIPAKFGSFGVIIFLYTLMTLYRFQKKLSTFGESTKIYRDTMIGFISIVSAVTLVYSPVEDKGFAFAIAYLLALGMQRSVVLQKGAS
jgi:hypothetical protein